MSQESLAARAGVSRAWLGFLDREPAAMTERAAEKIAAVLGVKPQALFLDRE